MKANLHQFFTQLSYLPRTLRLIWNAARGWTVAWALLLVIEGVLPAATVYLTKALIDSLAAALGGGADWENIRPSVILAGLMGGLMLLTQLLQSVMNLVRTAQSELVRDYLSRLVHEKSTTVDLAFYELPEFHDRLHRARSDLRQRPLALLESGGGLVQNSITLAAMGAMLLPYGIWLPPVLLISTLPAFIVVLRFNRRFHHWWQQTTTDRRWTQYYDMVLTNDAIAPELRIFNLGPHFQAAFQRIRQNLRSEQLTLIQKQNLAQVGAGITAALISGGAMLWMVWRAFLGQVTLGDLALFYQAFNQGQSLLRSLLGNAGRIYDNVLFLSNLFEFLELEPQVCDPPVPRAIPANLNEGIRFQQVTFRYPGSDRPVFQNFDFTVPAGKITAIVGANGAGKTTLVKLLCRFYDPEAGSVSLDGIDLRDLSISELRRMLTVMFQFPMIYTATIAENITMGDLTASPGMAEIELAAHRAGAHELIQNAPAGYDTLLGKLFAGGSELSGGERQRLSLARSYLRQAPIMILDEPTSLIDSWAEIDWFDRLRELANGRTSIIITHRFTIAKHADIIHVMDQGKMVESGSHQELMAQGGLYAHSWTQQIRENNTTLTSISRQNGNRDPLKKRETHE